MIEVGASAAVAGIVGAYGLSILRYPYAYPFPRWVSLPMVLIVVIGTPFADLATQGVVVPGHLAGFFLGAALGLLVRLPAPAVSGSGVRAGREGSD